MPPVIPRLQHVATSASTTYQFHCVPPEIGWANCTVNDGTGELLICSDWGSWSHRWDPRPACLGYPTLTAFLGRLNCIDYVARKLQREGKAGRQFSAVQTARNLQHQLALRRLGHGRQQISHRLEPADMADGRPLPYLSSNYSDDGMPLLSDEYVDAPAWTDPMRKERLLYLAKDEARRIWIDIERAAADAGSSTPDLFYHHVLHIDGITDYVTDEPWNYHATEQTSGDRALREIVLPALIAVCSAVANAAKSTPP